jgi:hypothetical protein
MITGAAISAIDNTRENGLKSMRLPGFHPKELWHGKKDFEKIKEYDAMPPVEWPSSFSHRKPLGWDNWSNTKKMNHIMIFKKTTTRK